MLHFSHGYPLVFPIKAVPRGSGNRRVIWRRVPMDAALPLLDKLEQFWFWSNVMQPPSSSSSCSSSSSESLPCPSSCSSSPPSSSGFSAKSPCVEIPPEKEKQRLLERRHRRCLSDQGPLDSSKMVVQIARSPVKESRNIGNPRIPKLQTIASGKEFEDPVLKKIDQEAPRATIHHRERKRGTKSLTDLEFDELKGFMDLGFTFNEDNLSPRVVRLLPGLQRYGNQEKTEETAISRPYLAEAWSVRRSETPLLNWQMPIPSDKGVNMKEQLKSWAHAVASTVRNDNTAI